MPIFGCRILSLNYQITPQKCSNRDLNPNRDWNCPSLLHVYSEKPGDIHLIKAQLLDTGAEPRVTEASSKR